MDELACGGQAVWWG